jgi:hypothetical protein
MLRRVALVRTDVWEEPGASIRVTRIGELGTTHAATSNRRMLRRTEDTILHSHRRENLKSYISKYELDLVGLQIRWEGAGTKPAGKCTFFCGKGKNHELGIDFFCA